MLVRTWYSGISAGTELATYRGTNPYLDRRWDPEMALFLRGGTTFSYPVDVWGYSEVGVVEAVGHDVTSLAAGDVVWGMWGHRSHAVLPAERLEGHRLPAGLDPMVGTFDRVGAVALNAVLAAGAFLGETVVVFGQGVIGLLATQLLAGQGIEVLAVDTVPATAGVGAQSSARSRCSVRRRRRARRCGEQTDGRGADRVIELTGAYPALHEAIRCAGVDGTVVAGGFYQGPATALRLGEEFHHNRVRLVPSQIGARADRAAAALDPPAAGLDRDAAVRPRPAGPAAAGHPRAAGRAGGGGVRAAGRAARRPAAGDPGLPTGVHHEASGDGWPCRSSTCRATRWRAKWEHAQRLGFDAIELRGAGEGRFAARLPELRAAAAAGVPMPTVCVEMLHFVGDFDADRRARRAGPDDGPAVGDRRDRRPAGHDPGLVRDVQPPAAAVRAAALRGRGHRGAGRGVRRDWPRTPRPKA